MTQQQHLASPHPATVPATAPNGAGAEPSVRTDIWRLRWIDARFYLAWLLPLCIGLAMLVGPWAAWLVAFGFQLCLAVTERLPFGRSSPAALPLEAALERRGFRGVLWGHALLQGGLLALALGHIADFSLFASGSSKAVAVVLLGLAVGTVSGGQGITYAHELGHSKRRLDRGLGWLLMASVNYCHFMVEHYRGHHPRAATHADPASARRGESLWAFLPRTLTGGLESAWVLEGQRLAQHRKDWSHSPLLWVTVAQVFWLLALGLLLGPWAVLFWLVQSAHAVFQLETINYIEHYGLVRRTVSGGLRPKPEPFAVHHAWNADHWLTNVFIANLQRHSDHHLHAWKPYASLEALPGPQLPTGYAGCLFLATVPGWWFATMHPRLDALAKGPAEPTAPQST